MSSPVDNDRDQHSMYVPPWARETSSDPASSDPFDTVQATVERLRRVRQQRQLPPEKDVPPDSGAAEEMGAAPERISAPERTASSPRLEPLHDVTRLRPRQGQQDAAAVPVATQADIETALGQFVRETWRPASLEPVPMPPPPKQSFSGPTWGMVARLSGAVGFAGVIAMLVAGAIPLPSITLPFVTDREANAAPVVGTVSFKSATPTAVAMVSAPERPAAERPAAVVPAFAPTAATGVASIGPPIIQPEMPQQVVSAPQVVAPEPPPKVTEPPRPVLAPDEIALLVKRGQDLVSQGDIAGGRLLLVRAAEAGDAQAALALAGTYDSTMLARAKVIGVAPDNARARTWYVKAAALGSLEAAKRLEQYANRAD